MRERLPLIRPAQRTIRALLVAAAAQAQRCHLADLARALAVPTLPASKVQRSRRTRDNERIPLDTHDRPIVRPASQAVRGQAVHGLLDRVRRKHHQNVVVASLGCRRRAVPLAWEGLDHRGRSDSERQRAVVDQAVPSLPPNVTVTVHGDAACCTTALFRWIRNRHWQAILGLRSSTHLYVSQGRAQAGQRIAAS